MERDYVPVLRYGISKQSIRERILKPTMKVLYLPIFENFKAVDPREDTET